MGSVSSAVATSVPRIQRPDVVRVGTIVWLGSEVMFFAGLFAIYFTLRSTHPDLWAQHTPTLNVPFASANTAILVLSSVTAQMGVFAAERFQPRYDPTRVWYERIGFSAWFLISFVLGAIFVSGQVFEYATLVSEGISFNTDAYSASFYLTTGFHALHVTAGLGAMLLMVGRAYAVKRYGHMEATSAIVVSYYWHFVDVVWVGLFAVIYILK